jgi:hypothetical protein
MDRTRLQVCLGRAAHIALACVALSVSGCLLAAAGVAGGAAGYAYYQGKVCHVYDSDYHDTTAAVHSALAELGMPVDSEELGARHGFVKSYIANGDAVRIYLDVISSKFQAEAPQTRVGIRVATFGDDPVSDRLLAQIGSHLVPPGTMATPQLGPPQSPGTIDQPLPPPRSVPTNTAVPATLAPLATKASPAAPATLVTPTTPAVPAPTGPPPLAN